MQDIHPIGGGGGRFFGGGGDRRLRPNNHLINHQALKCPRCDSANTKFCYYNNYNLSQPRHFCKSCRRYWTKGGVLRNVPVGGGCRKSKRSKPKSTPPNVEDVTEEPKSNSHSSSESSSLTATTTAAAANTSRSAAAAAASEAVSANSANTASTFINFSESNFFLPNGANPSYDHHHHHHQPLIDHSAEGHIFQDIGSFQNLMSSSNDHEFNMAEILTPLMENQNTNKQWNQMETDMKMEQMGGAGCFNQAGRDDQLNGLQQSRVNNSELVSLDWQTGSGEHGMYDLAGTLDQAYWSQTQWGENDQSLNFLP